MKSKTILFILLFLISFSSSAQQNFDLNVGEEETETANGILGSFSRIKNRFCDCDSNPRTLEESDINNIFGVWSTLLEANPNLVTEMMSSIDQLAAVNKSFNEQNDPNSFGLVVYMLKLFTEIGVRSGAVIDEKDINVILEIMAAQYEIDLPPAALLVLQNIKELRTSKDDRGVYEMTLITKNNEPIIIEPDQMGLPQGFNNDDSFAVRNITIENGASIKFYDNQAEPGACRMNGEWKIPCSIQDRMTKFLTDYSGFNEEYGNVNLEQRQKVIEHISSTNDQNMSPLFVRINGIEANLDVEVFSEATARVDITNAIVLPEIENENSLYLGTRVTLESGNALARLFVIHRKLDLEL